MAAPCHKLPGLQDFGSRGLSFSGKTFYLDLPPNKYSQRLVAAINRLGGVVESFLSRDVTYLVTAKKKRTGSGRRDAAGAKENHGNQSVSGPEVMPIRHGNQQFLNITSKPAAHYSRGKQLLNKVLPKQDCSSALSRAHTWGVRILHVDMVMQYIARQERSSTQQSQKKLSRGASTSSTGLCMRVLTLRKPYLKIEDQSRKFRPVKCIFSSFPEFLCKPSDKNLFHTGHAPSGRSKEKEPCEQEEEANQKHRAKRRGFCECCEEMYSQISEHVVSGIHLQYIQDPSNYLVVDELIDSLTCDLMEWPHRCGSSSRAEPDAKVVRVNATETHMACSEAAVQQAVKPICPEVANGCDDVLEKTCHKKEDEGRLQCALYRETDAPSHAGAMATGQAATCDALGWDLENTVSLVGQLLHMKDTADPVYPSSLVEDYRGPVSPPHNLSKLLPLVKSIHRWQPEPPELSPKLPLPHTEAGATDATASQHRLMLKDTINEQNLQLQFGKRLALGHLSLAPWYPVQDDRFSLSHTKPSLSWCSPHTGSAQGTFSQISSRVPPAPEQVCVTVGWHSNKRKHSGSEDHPPAKRQQGTNGQPVSLSPWLLCGLSDYNPQPVFPVLTKRAKPSCSKIAAPNPAPSNPRLPQQRFSSTSDWDVHIPSHSQDRLRPLQDCRELNLCPLSLEDGWYKTPLCSVLAHNQQTKAWAPHRDHRF